MNDVTDRLARLDTAAVAPTEGTVADDLARAHTALGRRRRTRAAFAGAGLTLGVGAALGVVAVVGDNAADAPPSAGPSSSDGGREQRGGVALVNYVGDQPEGFELAKVPAGYEVQGSDEFVLTLAEPGDDSHYLDFRGKVVVSLESRDAPGGLPDGEAVTVDGEPGVLYASPDGFSHYLAYYQGDHHVLIQVWKTVGLTDDQLVELAEAITVTGDVRVPIG